MWLWTFLYVCVVVGVSSDENSRLVQLAQGPVRGYKTDGDIFAFYGVRYATAPTGRHKYKPPLPAPLNQETLEAIDNGIVCPQVITDPNYIPNKTMHEDCLIANIFVPDTNISNLPVLVSVHGGAFQQGSGNGITYYNLIKTKDMIVVTFNYRLGVHGFLCLGTKDIPGNAGMKDQVALLRWVKNNIRSFGGNPNDISIGGFSAGASSVDLLMLSKSAQGLFNKVIPESASAMAAASIQPDPLQNAKMFAKRLNFTNVDDIHALENFYKSVPLKKLMIDTFVDRTDSTFVFSPCVERNNGDEIFIDDDPTSIIKNGNYVNVPLLIGFANMEGLLRIDFFDKWKAAMNEKFSDFLPADLKFKNEVQKEEIANKVKQFYFGDKPVGNESVLAYISYFSDVIFTIPALRSIDLHLKNGHDKIYLYEYSFTDEDVPLVPHTKVRGANHCAQTMALIDGKNFFSKDENSISDEYKKMKGVIRKLWSNFIITGQPVSKGSSLPPWPTVGTNWTPYMSLGQKLELKSALLKDHVRFWDDIYNKHYRKPLSPPSFNALNLEL